ncbi:nuclear transport factor 2 family protein [Pseudorhodobacter sp. W20_MBD10_FR17]|uniref:nuclear transport factor 2 family protein n=1 Tax=Pseudorhodobacter sp. W20_MBD10_FR17 TaxID=3240266 RepID=UPI003F9E7D71
MKLNTLAASAAAVTFVALAAAADTNTNKTLAIEALGATLGAGNPAAVDQYFAPDYVQHNPDIADGAEPLKGMIGHLAASGAFKADVFRVIADGDLVAFHSRYEGFGPTPMIAFDVFRIEDGKIAEHWDNLIPEAAPNPSGHTQTDGATELTDLDKTAANKALVEEFVTKALITHEHIEFTDYINPTNYVQHNPMVADGLQGFGAFMGEMAAKGITMTYNEVHQVIGEGNFVLTLSDGAIGDQAQAFYDLFRVEDGLIVEHWDVIAPMPATDAPHNKAGKF